MRNLTAFALGLFLSSCASQKGAAPLERHLAHLPASFTQPKSEAVLKAERALNAHALRAQRPRHDGEHCLTRDPSPHRFDFADADVNKDKKVSRGEFNCEALAWFGHADPDRDRRLDLKHAHKDHHAELSRHSGGSKLHVMQFLTAMDLRFARSDKNRDGYLDAKEYAAARLSSLSKGAR